MKKLQNLTTLHVFSNIISLRKKIMLQEKERIGFVTYTQNKKIPLGIVSQSYKQKAVTTHYCRKIRKNLITIEDKRFFLIQELI